MSELVDCGHVNHLGNVCPPRWADEDTERIAAAAAIIASRCTPNWREYDNAQWIAKAVLSASDRHAGGGGPMSELDDLDNKLTRTAWHAANLATKYEHRDTAEWHLKEITHLLELARIQIIYAQRAITKTKKEGT